jgi:ABC-2 type transport system permease protein
MTNIARLTRWEWFKLRRRWMPWILLLILVVFSQLAIWAVVFQYRSVVNGGNVIVNSVRRGGGPESVSCAKILAEPPVLPEGVDPALVPAFRTQCVEVAKQRDEQLRPIYADISLPGSIKLALSTPIGTILIAVLSASVVGVEYGWGTMRTTLTRGTGRMPYLAGKFAVLLLAALGALLVVAIAAAISSTIASSTGIISAPPGFVAATWTTALEAIGRAWFALVPMIALLVMLTVLTASSATSMAIGIGYTIAEPIVLALLRQISERLNGVSDYLLAANISGWSSGSMLVNHNSSVSSLHHFIVLIAYTTVFTIVAFKLITSRDVAKATGT